MIKWYWVVLIAIIVLIVAYIIGKKNNTFSFTNTTTTIKENEPITVEDTVKRIAAEVNSETSNQRISVSQKYNLLNQKLEPHGIWVGPDGTNPPNGILKKCCCRSSIFFGTIPVDCYWSVDCGSTSAQAACSVASA